MRNNLKSKVWYSSLPHPVPVTFLLVPVTFLLAHFLSVPTIHFMSQWGMTMGLTTKPILTPQAYHAAVQCLEWPPTQHRSPPDKQTYPLIASNTASSRRASLNPNSSPRAIRTHKHTDRQTDTHTHHFMHFLKSFLLQVSWFLKGRALYPPRHPLRPLWYHVPGLEYLFDSIY